MRVDTLEAYSVPAEIIEIWRRHIGPELLPVQERAVKEFGLFGDDNLIVFSPTSSGKTFVGEMAAVRAARNNTKVFYAVPQKALAEEKYQEFTERYQQLGLRIAVSSRDHREFDADIERLRFDIAVVVVEKLQALLVTRPDLMESVGLVVVDEMQLITDEQRGPTLELILTKLRVAASKPRLVGLSAVLGNAQELAKWLGAKLLIDKRRPTELRKGVFCRGTFTYREHNSGAEGVEAFEDTETQDDEENILRLAEQLVRRGEQVLTFLPDRQSTVFMARRFASRVTLPPVQRALDELRDQEETLGRDTLREVLARAVAFHNADLSADERRLVEQHFRTGDIRATFATSTLAMGMNFPVKNVILSGERWHHYKQYDTRRLTAITKSEYENMSGRAGRYGRGGDFGRSLLITASSFHVPVKLRQYVESDFPDIEPTLANAPLENHVIDLLATGMARDADSLRLLLMSSYTGMAYWGQRMSADQLDAMLTEAIGQCVNGRLAKMKANGNLRPTDLGLVCARKGIGVTTAVALARWAEDARSASTLTPLEVLTVACLTSAAGEMHVEYPKGDRSRAGYRDELLGRALHYGLAARPLFEKIAIDQSCIEFETARAYKKALLLADWIDEVKTSELERRYRVWAGAVKRLGEEFAWLVDAAAAIVSVLGWADNRVAEMAQLAERLLFGVRPDALPLARLRVPALGRHLLRRLVDGGVPDEAAARATDREVLRRIVNHRRAFAALCARLDGGKVAEDVELYRPALAPLLLVAEPRGNVADASPISATPTAPVRSPSGKPSDLASPAVARPSPETATLVVDLREHRVSYLGHAIPTRPPHNLQRQPLLALAVLASRNGEVVTMAELALGMFELGALRRRPVAPDARDLRYKMLRAFRRALDGRLSVNDVDRLIESLPAGMRLNVTGRVVVVPAGDAVEPKSVRRAAG